jgi:hypothetical protein
MEQLSLWNESTLVSIWQRCLYSLGRHKNAVTIISAFLVFISFIVKDSWDEHLKDLATSIENARKDIDRDDEHSLMLTILRAVYIDSTALEAKLIEGKSDTKDSIKVSNIRANDYDSQNSVIRNVEIAGRVSKFLPDRQEYEKQFKEINLANASLGGDMSKFEAKKIEFGAEQRKVLDERISKLVSRADRLRGKALLEADSLHDWNERYHKICVRLTYLLFAVGWALGLVSNLAGVKGT